MNTQFWVVQAFNGISYGALLFLVGSGLSLIFGVMRIVNLSHGAYFLWGGYIALVGDRTPPVRGRCRCRSQRSRSRLIGLLMERLFLRSRRARKSPQRRDRGRHRHPHQPGDRAR